MAKIKQCFLFSLVLLFAAGAMAQVKRVDFEEYDLSNGLHVILHRDTASPLVVINVMYHVGSKNEKDSLRGFAHFFEHLMFEGTDNIGRSEYTTYVEKAGGSLNAYTTPDLTNYYEVLPSNQLALGLWLESERMLHARVDHEGIKTQKDVVIEEKKQRYDNQPYGKLNIEIMKRAFQVHPYRITTIGIEDHIRGAADSEFVEFYKTFYVPDNAVLVVAGDFEPDSTRKLIETWFGDIPRGTKPVFRPDPNSEPTLAGEVRDTVYDRIRLPAVIHAFRIPASDSPDYYAVDMVNSILTRGNSSRMRRVLIDEKQVAISTQAYSMSLEHPGVALAYSFPRVDVSLDSLEAAMDEEYARVRNELISETEFEKLRNQLETEYINSLASLERRASKLAESYTVFGNTSMINSRIDKYLSVSREDIQRAARTYFVPSNRVVLYYLPYPAM